MLTYNISSWLIMELENYSKKLIQDKEFISDVREESLAQVVLRRVYAVNKAFVDVSFKQSEISRSYFRNCCFIRCDFTGANIKSSNFRGAKYEECKFQYSTWEHTQLDEEFLDNCLPSEENLARDLVRSLRVNFGHIGNYTAVNKAASIEVSLTGRHLFLAAYSKQSYYRSKYRGLDRFLQGFRHLRWKLLDLLWGNGESLYRVFFSGIFIILVWSTYLAWQFPEASGMESFKTILLAFWGAPIQLQLPSVHIAAITAIRFVLVGLFMAILIKRLARR